MKNLPVNWHEGVFLHPHHFQAADRYWQELVSTSQKWDHPYFYGLEDFNSSFAGTVFRVDKIHARMRDGTLAAREENDPPLTVDLAGALQDNDAVRVYLCIPQLRPRDVNVGSDSGDDQTRFVQRLRELYDENQSGGNEREIALRDLNVRLLLETDEREGYEQLPIAQVKRSTGEDSSPQLDDTYIPPVLSTHAWTQLGRGIIRGVHDLIIQNSNDLQQMLRDVDLKDHILEVSQSGRFALLDRLNEISCAMAVIIPALGVHPFTSYLQLCDVVGKLAIFTTEKRPPELPRYDHDKLGYIFREVATLIRIMLESIQFKDYLQKNFLWEGDVMKAELTPAWFDPRVDWFLGVDRPQNVSDAECRRLLSREQNNFLWKFGSKDHDIYNFFDQGLELQDVSHGDQERVLPPHQYWTYWRIPKDETHRVFRAVSKSQTVAAYIKDQKNPTFDLNEYAGTGRFPVTQDQHGEAVEFQLSLFGVRK